jgi:hypothetical protein
MKIAIATLALFAAASEAAKVEKFRGTTSCAASDLVESYTLSSDGACRPISSGAMDTIIAAGLVNEIKTAVNGTNFFTVSCAGDRFVISYFSDDKCTPINFPEGNAIGHSIARNVDTCHISPASPWSYKYTCSDSSGGPSDDGNNSGNGGGSGNNSGGGSGSVIPTMSTPISRSVAPTRSATATADAAVKSDAGHLVFSLGALVAGTLCFLL